jgi:hypothetical protein
MPASFLTADELKQWAAKCEQEANQVRLSREERFRLLKMRRALLELAHQQDWLDGKPDDEPKSPPAFIVRKAQRRR